MLYSEAKAIRDFCVKNTPAGHKARNVSRDTLSKINAKIQRENSSRPDVYDAQTGAFLGRDKIAEIDFEITPEEAAEMTRAHQLAQDHVAQK